MTEIDKKPKPVKRKLEEESNEAAELSQKRKTEKELAIKNQASVEEVVDRKVEEEHEEVEDDDESRMAIAATSESRNQGDGEANDAVRIKNLLEPLSKEVLFNILSIAAEKYVGLGNLIQEIAEKDSAHREIFVYNINKHETRSTIFTFFQQYGEIEYCHPIYDKVSGNFKRFAFILFKSASGARNALKQPEKKIGTCRLAARDSKIFVSNVAPGLNPQKLLEYFSKYGEIEEGPLGLDRCTGKPKGFCLFIYKSPESAEKALEEPVKSFEGHALYCKKGTKSGKQHQHHHTNQHHNHSPYQRNNISGCSTPGGHVHLMASNQAGMGGPAAQPLNPAVGQCFAAFVAPQGGGYVFNHPVIGQHLLGSYGTATANGAGMPTGYGAQAMTPGTMPGYGIQPGLQGGYQAPPPIQGSTGRGQHWPLGLSCIHSGRTF